MPFRIVAAMCLCHMLSTSCLRGDDVEAKVYRLTDIHPAGIGGTIIMHGPGAVANALRTEFVTAAGGPNARIVVISLGGPYQLSNVALARGDFVVDAELTEELAAFWKSVEANSVYHLQPENPEELTVDALAPLTEATGVWFEAGVIAGVDWVSNEFKSALQGVLDRGGLIGGTQSAAVVAERYTYEFAGEVHSTAGLGLLPQVIVTHVAMPAVPGYVSIHVEPQTVAFVHQRTLGVVGQGGVHITPYYHVHISSDNTRLTDGQTADCTALRRMCTLGPRFRRGDEEPAVCEVPSGSLMIVGGGGFTDEMLNRFVELAGGAEAKIVVVPSAEEDPQLVGRQDAQDFIDAGAASAVVLHTHDRVIADSDEFIAPLNEATGIWFGGGRQWRLLDAFTGTKTEAAMRGVLERGGVIGGSSAGATIQGDYLVRGNPLGNVDMMSAGYEDGFCYLPGCAIDQHFTARNRHPDMVLFKQHLPRMLGIGIDETTALVVTGHSAEVMGQGKVFFYDGAAAEQCEQRTEVSAGQTYDLIERRIVE